tara:strand:+ start:304 stop:1302 length:999 start_codon:yes stop_codon:yes gene_type:complete
MPNISSLAKKVDGLIEGDSNLTIKGIGDLRTSPKDFVSFLSDDRYYKYFEESNSNIILVNKNFSQPRLQKTLIRVENPVFAYIQLLEYFSPKKQYKTGIHNTAIISKSAQIGQNVSIGPYAVIGSNVKIEDSSFIGPSCYIGDHVIIGQQTIIKPNVSIYNNISIGSFCIVESGTVIGADGFGLTFHNGENHIIPHMGKVIIEDKVWVGANCAIDKGTINNTIIGFGTKMDNLIQIAHNVQIGQHCVIAGQSAIAGSTTIGDYVTIAGQVGIIGHLNIGNHCTIASKSQVTKSLNDKSFVSGIPARDHKKNLKLNAQLNNLDSLYSKLKNEK